MPVSIVSRADEILRNLELVYGQQRDRAEPAPQGAGPQIRGAGREGGCRERRAAEHAAVDVPARRSRAGADPRPDQGPRHQLADPDRGIEQTQRNQEDNWYLIKRYWKSNIPKPRTSFREVRGLCYYLISVILIIHAFFFSYYAFLIFVGTLT